jgi:hypothetical protein
MQTTLIKAMKYCCKISNMEAEKAHAHTYIHNNVICDQLWMQGQCRGQGKVRIIADIPAGQSVWVSA